MDTFVIKIADTSYHISTRYRAESKDLLVFLHGLGCSKKNFDEAWNCLAFQKFSLLSFDFIGFGDSVKPDGFSYKMESQAAVCSDILRRFPDADLHVIAHSMGEP